ncbi:MAG TPA: response regulator [Myxococcota bacterium]
MKVFVIDDDPVTLEVIRATLESLGHEVVTLKSPIGAAATMMRERPDLALVDVQMPGLSGDDWLRLIREKKLLGKDLNVDFVLHSGLPAEELEHLVKKTGAMGAIRKEGNPASFAAAFRRITERET